MLKYKKRCEGEVKIINKLEISIILIEIILS